VTRQWTEKPLNQCSIPPVEGREGYVIFVIMPKPVLWSM